MAKRFDLEIPGRDSPRPPHPCLPTPRAAPCGRGPAGGATFPTTGAGVRIKQGHDRTLSGRGSRRGCPRRDRA